MTISNDIPLHKRALELLPGIPGRDQGVARYEMLAEILLGATIPADHSLLCKGVREASASMGQADSALTTNLLTWIGNERQRVAREAATKDMLRTASSPKRDVGEAAGFSREGRPNALSIPELWDGI